jgi:uncharacterized protein YunC (DUF1805 family)
MTASLIDSLPPELKNALSLLDSITDVAASDAGRLVLSGSHGGLYPASLASRAGVRAVVFNDAGIGLDAAGVGGVKALNDMNMAAAAVDCFSARIGSTEDMLASGRISTVNDCAAQTGVSIGMSVTDALQLMNKARSPTATLPPVPEARWEYTEPQSGVSLLCVDSASLVTPEDGGRIIITGSHGGLIGGNPARALKARARFAVFNDAGGGKDDIGWSRLPALDAAGVAAVTVASSSAIIGSAQSCVDHGVISHANKLAQQLGVTDGESLATALTRICLATDG